MSLIPVSDIQRMTDPRDSFSYRRWKDYEKYRTNDCAPLVDNFQVQTESPFLDALSERDPDGIERAKYQVVIGQMINSRFDYQESFKMHLEWLQETLKNRMEGEYSELKCILEDVYQIRASSDLLDNIRRRAEVIVVLHDRCRVTIPSRSAAIELKLARC